MSEPTSAEIESQLKGKTLIVYWFMLRAPDLPVGVREVQRELGFSSPSVSAHHLDKLHSLGLVDKSLRGEYFLKREVKVGEWADSWFLDTFSIQSGSQPCSSSISCFMDTAGESTTL
jgi:hypothetical protein